MQSLKHMSTTCDWPSTLRDGRREEGNEPYSAVVLRGAEVVDGHNLAKSMHDPTAHAEVVAVRNAAPAWRSDDLRGATLYASFEPCPMCLGAMLVSGISELATARAALSVNSCWATTP